MNRRDAGLPTRAPRALASCALACMSATAPLCAAEHEGPQIHDTITYRDIEGRTEADLVAGLKRISLADKSSDRVFAANTHWQLQWNFGVESPPRGSCRLASVATTLDIEMNLPRWNPPSDAPAPLVSRWRTFAAAVRKHEDGHRDIAVEAVHEIESQVERVPPARNCELLKKNLTRAAEATLKTYRDKEDSYDVTTMHGRAQGATFP